jgi:hypothetical protein
MQHFNILQRWFLFFSFEQVSLNEPRADGRVPTRHGAVQGPSTQSKAVECSSVDIFFILFSGKTF